MADLEQHAFRRDRRFVVRLAFTLIVALLGGMFIAGWLTSDGTAGCTANMYLSGDAKEEAEPAPR